MVLVVNEVGVATGELSTPSTPEETGAEGAATGTDAELATPSTPEETGVDSALTGMSVVISVVDAGTRVV